MEVGHGAGIDDGKVVVDHAPPDEKGSHHCVQESEVVWCSGKDALVDEAFQDMEFLDYGCGNRGQGLLGFRRQQFGHVALDVTGKAGPAAQYASCQGVSGEQEAAALFVEVFVDGQGVEEGSMVIDS